MSTATLIGTIITVVVGPLLALLIKWWLNRAAATAAADAKEAGQQKDTDADEAAKSSQTGAVNDSIAKQKAAREQWLKDHPNG